MGVFCGKLMEMYYDNQVAMYTTYYLVFNERMMRSQVIGNFIKDVVMQHWIVYLLHLVINLVMPLLKTRKEFFSSLLGTMTFMLQFKREYQNSKGYLCIVYISKDLFYNYVIFLCYLFFLCYINKGDTPNLCVPSSLYNNSYISFVCIVKSLSINCRKTLLPLFSVTIFR